jgi:hypothetical protein
MPDRDFNIKDGNWFPIMHEMADKLMVYRLSGTEWQVLFMFMRFCYGYQDSACELGWKDMKDFTGLQDGPLSRNINKLKTRNILNTSKIGSKQHLRYKINSKISTWKTLPKMEVLTKVEANTPKFGSTPIKDNKDNIPPIVPLKKSPEKPKKKKALPSITWPSDFILTEKMKEYAIKHGIDPKKVDAFFEDFRNWADQNEKTYKNWEAGFRTRVGKAPDWGKQFMAIDEEGGLLDGLRGFRARHQQSG